MSILIALALSQAAQAAPRQMTPDEARQWTMMSRMRLLRGQEMAMTLKPKAKQSALTQALSGVTRLVLVQQLGLYASYTAPDGSLSAWFPGQQRTIAGRWGVSKFSAKAVAACFRYQRPGETREGPFQPDECVLPEQTLGQTDVLQQWPGDVFNLAGGSVPHVKAAWEIVAP